MITNTHSVLRCADAVIHGASIMGQRADPTGLLVVAAGLRETLGRLGSMTSTDFTSNRSTRFHPSSSRMEERLRKGSRLRGTGMICTDSKRHRSGTVGPTAYSDAKSGLYTVGVRCMQLRPAHLTCALAERTVGSEIVQKGAGLQLRDFSQDDRVSIRVVVGTMPPLVSPSLKRPLAAFLSSRRNGIPLRATGPEDLSIAFSTANPGAAAADHASTNNLPQRKTRAGALPQPCKPTENHHHRRHDLPPNHERERKSQLDSLCARELARSPQENNRLVH